MDAGASAADRTTSQLASRVCIRMTGNIPVIERIRQPQPCLRTTSILRVRQQTGIQGSHQHTLIRMLANNDQFLTTITPRFLPDLPQLLSAVDRALQRDAAERAERAVHSQVRDKLEALTARERQVLDGVARGLLNKQIGEELCIALGLPLGSRCLRFRRHGHGFAAHAAGEAVGGRV